MLLLTVFFVYIPHGIVNPVRITRFSLVTAGSFVDDGRDTQL